MKYPRTIFEKDKIALQQVDGELWQFLKYSEEFDSWGSDLSEDEVDGVAGWVSENFVPKPKFLPGEIAERRMASQAGGEYWERVRVAEVSITFCGDWIYGVERKGNYTVLAASHDQLREPLWAEGELKRHAEIEAKNAEFMKGMKKGDEAEGGA